MEPAWRTGRCMEMLSSERSVSRLFQSTDSLGATIVLPKMASGVSETPHCLGATLMGR
ncbi:hypothetical protein HNP02_007309 [Mycobacterium sp. AZCC_0083]|nr:hypothetical protein [Mycobacterium sp. AZCC_0083]